jgi:hypothetical protein
MALTATEAAAASLTRYFTRIVPFAPSGFPVFMVEERYRPISIRKGRGGEIAIFLI